MAKRQGIYQSGDNIKIEGRMPAYIESRQNADATARITDFRAAFQAVFTGPASA
jgi:hypothetical protein